MESARQELIANHQRWEVVDVSRWWEKWQAKVGDEKLGAILRELQGQKTFPPPALDKLESVSKSRTDIPKPPPRVPSPVHELRRARSFFRKAEKTAIGDFQAGLVQDEEGVTERLIGAIHQQFNHRVYAGIRWSAKTLTAHKRNAQETIFGADLLGVLSVRLPNYSVSKGFLAQAKLLRHSDTLIPSEFQRLQQQCKKMLDHSNASYVFIYQREGISIIPALAALSLTDPQRLPTLKRLSFVQFFEDHFNCYIGDRALHTPTDATLEQIREKVSARNALMLSGESTEPIQ